ncbi:MAG: immune inhibitor A, partial [Candidatus Poseidoniaceae archaeon]|nr:immune inhibitor A [Candidatus Poseidoniaceae archaeon]
MQRILSVAMALLLLVSGAALTQRDGWFERFTVESEPASTDPLTPWQHGEENWLVLVVDFEDATTQSTGLGVAQAVSLMEGEIVPYLSMMSGDADVNFTVHPEVLRAPEPSTVYGKDGSAGRDFSNDGTFLPATLVSELVQSLDDDVAWSDHDLVDDGTVDRLLILHTSRGQEAGSGGNDRIWSHFTHLMEPVRVAPGIDVAHYAMATMRGGTGASGTVVHEMLHQIGAVDLYPVHDPAWSGTWHGLGDWDIMASGNWNGNGVWPALPTAASMQLMGLDTSSNVVLDFPVQRDGVCLGPTLDLTALHEGGASLRVDLTEQQRVFIELK